MKRCAATVLATACSIAAQALLRRRSPRHRRRLRGRRQSGGGYGLGGDLPAALRSGCGDGPKRRRPPRRSPSPARETWYAEPAKVADNLYFPGTKIHSAWAIEGSEGIILIEALFDYATKDEILDGMKKLGLDKSRVKYILLSHAHADHDGGAKLLQDEIPGGRLIYGAQDWDAIDKAPTHARRQTEARQGGR